MCVFLCQVKARGRCEALHSSHTKLAAKALHTTQGDSGNKQGWQRQKQFFCFLFFLKGSILLLLSP